MRVSATFQLYRRVNRFKTPPLSAIPHFISHYQLSNSGLFQACCQRYASFRVEVQQGSKLYHLNGQQQQSTPSTKAFFEIQKNPQNYTNRETLLSNLRNFKKIPIKLFPFLNTFGNEHLNHVAHSGFARYLYFTTASSVFSMFAMSIGSHALLSAFFVDSTPSIWLLKDLMPTLLTVAITSRITSFDKYRRFWYVSSMTLTQISVMLEFLAPIGISSFFTAAATPSCSAAPQTAAVIAQTGASLLTSSNCLLATAVLSSLLRGVGMLMIGITRTSIIEHFSRNRNAGELAKTVSSLQILMYTLSGAAGLVFASSCTSFELKATAIAIASVTSVACGYFGVVHIGTRVLTLNILLRQIQHFVDTKYTSVFAPDQFAALTGLWEVAPYLKKEKEGQDCNRNDYINRIQRYNNDLVFTPLLSSLCPESTQSLAACLDKTLDTFKKQSVNTCDRHAAHAVFMIAGIEGGERKNRIGIIFFEVDTLQTDETAFAKLTITEKNISTEDVVRAVVEACDAFVVLDEHACKNNSPLLLSQQPCSDDIEPSIENPRASEIKYVDRFCNLLSEAGWLMNTHAFFNRPNVT